MGLIVLLVVLAGAGGGGRGEDASGRIVWFGRSMVGVGDCDGDEVGDFLVSAPRRWATDGVTESVGAVYAYSGATGELMYECTGPWGFGDSMAPLGDINEDGAAEFAVGAGGGVHVCSGSDGTTIYSIVEQGWPGTVVVDSVSDLTGDGIRDLVGGWPAYSSAPNGKLSVSSRVDVWDGANGELLTRVMADTVHFEDGTRVDHVGRRVWGLHDIDGDGRSEIAFSASGSGGAGSKSFICVAAAADGSVLFRLDPGRAVDEAGLALTRIGDWDGDGHADFALGAGVVAYDGLVEIDSYQKFEEGWPDVLGQVTVHSGSTGAQLSSIEQEGRTPRFGHSLVGDVDVDGDGTPDILVSDYGWFLFGGVCYAYSGLDGRLLRRTTRRAGSDYGATVAVLSDLDGDGIREYAVSAMNDEVMSRAPGMVFVYSGKTGRELYRLP